jgi:hypothetical protein
LEAAQACLTVLQERYRGEPEPQTLLRPASPPSRPAAVLLRSAAGSPDGDPDRLLRADADDE